jgi:hypothetical protein
MRVGGKTVSKEWDNFISNNRNMIISLIIKYVLLEKRVGIWMRFKFLLYHQQISKVKSNTLLPLEFQTLKHVLAHKS